MPPLTAIGLPRSATDSRAAIATASAPARAAAAAVGRTSQRAFGAPYLHRHSRGCRRLRGCPADSEVGLWARLARRDGVALPVERALRLA